MHLSHQIRDVIVATITGLQTTGNNVHTSRIYNYQTMDLPALAVEIGGAEIEEDELGLGDRIQNWKQEYKIKITARNTGDIDADVWQIIEEVNEALADNNKLNGLAKDSMPVAVNEGDFSDESEKKLTTREIIFHVMYLTTNTAQDTAL